MYLMELVEFLSIKVDSAIAYKLQIMDHSLKFLVSFFHFLGIHFCGLFFVHSLLTATGVKLVCVLCVCVCVWAVFCLLSKVMLQNV